VLRHGGALPCQKRRIAPWQSDSPNGLSGKGQLEESINVNTARGHHCSDRVCQRWIVEPLLLEIKSEAATLRDELLSEGRDLGHDVCSVSEYPEPSLLLCRSSCRSKPCFLPLSSLFLGVIDARVSCLAEVTHSTRDAARVPGNEEGKGKGDPIPAYILGHRHACVCDRVQCKVWEQQRQWSTPMQRGGFADLCCLICNGICRSLSNADPFAIWCGCLPVG